MKKLLAIVLGLVCATSLTVIAAGGGGGTKAPARSEDQEKVWKEILKTYDKNGDGRIDKTEAAEIKKEDLDKLDKAGLGKTGRPVKKKTTTP
jgi:hypothetical protein